MGYYLFFDAVDDKFQTPSIPFTAIEIDFAVESAVYWGKYVSFNYAWFQRNSNTENDQWDTTQVNVVKKNGVPQTNLTDFVIMGERAVFRIEFKNPMNTAIHVFSNMGAVQSGGRLYQLKVYNNEQLQAHYDASTGTVLDQSGNGRHATLVGGAWVDDGQGGETEPEPTPISIQFPTRQTIFKPISVNVNTEQSIYKTISESHSTKQSIYKQTNTSHLTNQQIYKPIAEQFGTKQSIYKRVSFDFPIGIVITALTNYVASFPTEQIIYKQIVSDNPTNQAVYKSISESTPTEQNIFKQMSYEFKTAQQIFKRVINDAAIRQVIYKYVSDNNPLQIRIIIPGAPELIGVIRLKGKRDLYVRLKGKCDLTVRLKGGLQMYENQNFKRTQGDTIPIEFDCAENLTGSTFKWGMKKRGEDQLVLLKEGVVTGNIVRVLLEPTDTEKLLGIFEHECETIDQHGNVTTIAKGLATITEGFVK